MENAKPEDRINQLEAQGFATDNVECFEQHRERRALRTEPPVTDAELEEYRLMLPTLRWLQENRAAIEQAIIYQLPTIVAGCPLASRLLSRE